MESEVQKTPKAPQKKGGKKKKKTSILFRKTKKGRRYYGCEDNPNCEFMSWQKPSEKKCPECGKYLIEKGNKLCCSDEKCGFVENIGK